MNLNERLEAIARDVAKREAPHAEAIASARETATKLHGQVDTAMKRFNETLGESVPELQVDVSVPRIDDKHVHAIEFDVARGRHRAVVTVKSKGEVTLVGPFHKGKKEGPCRSFPVDAQEDIADALGDFLERFLEEATSP